MQVTGSIKMVGTTQTFGDNGFRKRELVITTDEQYPQMILIEFIQDKCDLLDSYVEGQNVIVSINLKGREWINPQGEAKYFNSIGGWRIEKAEQSGQENNAPTTSPIASDNKPDDLPF